MNEMSFNFLDPEIIIWPLLKMFWPFFAFVIVFVVVTKLLETFVKQKTFEYFLKKNKPEIFTFMFAVIGYIVSYTFLKSPGLLFLLSVIVTFVATVVLIYLKMREKDFYFISLQKDADREDWIGKGIFKYERAHNAYTITDSYSGFIYSKCLTWSDYVLEFDFKILKESLGVILRATNLSNLVMMQISEEGIRPHIRVNGFWQAWESKESKLVFNKKINLDKWYWIRLQCDKGSIRIRIYNADSQAVFDRVWEIPSGDIPFTYELPNNFGLVAKGTKSSIPFPINLEYGTIGFRNHNQEKALVKNVLIEKLQGTSSAD
jgi:hypothetical protein